MAGQSIDGTWLNSPLFVALMTITLTLVTTQVSAFIERWILRRQRARSIKLAFQGEIYAVRGALSGPAKTAVTAWKSGTVLMKYGIADRKVKIGMSEEDATDTDFCNRVISEVKASGVIKKDFPA